MDKLLFTPGPLTTSGTVKSKMYHDLGSRDNAFISIVKEIREALLKVTGLEKDDGYETVLIQGSGTYGIEAVISSAIPENGKLLVIVNGSYGQRMVEIASVHNIAVIQLNYEEDEAPSAIDVKKVIEENSDISHVGIVHCETSTGIMNPITEIGIMVSKYNLTYIVDAMSSFGAVPIDMRAAGIDFLVSSSNKCIEGVPGFSFVIARKKSLLLCKGQSRTLSLDLYDQWETMEYNGQFRFTPPVQVLLAFRQALDELEEEGGVEGRAKRYSGNHRVLVEGMKRMGFQDYIKKDLQGYIITTFLFPTDKSFDFNRFYTGLSNKGFVIYPGKLTKTDSFRIGNIGQLYEQDIYALLEAVSYIIGEMGLVSCSGT